MGPITGRLRFQPSRPAPSLPHQVPNEHAENAGARKRRHPEEPPALDDVDGPTVGASSAERWSLERHQEGGRPCGNKAELSSTSSRSTVKPTPWRAKSVPR